MSSRWSRLVELRKAVGLSQYELAKRLNLTRTRLANYEQGGREPDFELTKRIAAYFSVSVDDLLGTRQSEQTMVEEIPTEWKSLIAQARADGYSPDQVVQALRLLESIKRQHGENENKERKD